MALLLRIWTATLAKMRSNRCELLSFVVGALFFGPILPAMLGLANLGTWLFRHYIGPEHFPAVYSAVLHYGPLVTLPAAIYGFIGFRRLAAGRIEHPRQIVPIVVPGLVVLGGWAAKEVLQTIGYRLGFL